LNNLKTRAGTQAKLFEPGDPFRGTNDLADFSYLTAAKKREWNELGHGFEQVVNLRTILNNDYRDFTDRRTRLQPPFIKNQKSAADQVRRFRA
jgi:hypothetical protein